MEKERKKAEKEAKFAVKKAKQQAEKAAGGAIPGDTGKKREKKTKEPEPVEEEFVDETKPGEKKSRGDLPMPFLHMLIVHLVQSSNLSTTLPIKHTIPPP